MRKQIVLAILLISMTLFSFNEKEKTFQNTNRKKSQLFSCGPAFDSAYNQSSSMVIDYLGCVDPFDNSIPHDVYLEPLDNLDISDSGSLCSYAGGWYSYAFVLKFPITGGSIKIIDLNNGNAVVACTNTLSTKTNYHLSINAQCGAYYAIILSDVTC